MEPARRRQLTHLSDARQELLAWATANGIPLVRLEFVVLFIDADFGTNVWLFYDTDVSVASCADAGTTANVQRSS